MKLALILIASIVLVAGCAQPPPEAQPSFRILSPAEGQALTGDDAVISLQTENVIIASPTGEVIPNQGHFHFFLDNGNEQVTPAAVFTYENLTPGLHIIRIELRRGDHSPFNPAVIKSVSFTVPGATGALPSPATLPVPATNATTNTTTPATNATNTTNTTSPPPAPPQPVKEFNVTATSWTFTPSTITVNKDDKVIINAKSTDVDHGLAITAYGVNLFLDGGGATVTATFTADKTGEFTFFCSVACGAGHSSMNGKLIVNP